MRVQITSCRSQVAFLTEWYYHNTLTKGIVFVLRTCSFGLKFELVVPRKSNPLLFRSVHNPRCKGSGSYFEASVCEIHCELKTNLVTMHSDKQQYPLYLGFQMVWFTKDSNFLPNPIIPFDEETFTSTKSHFSNSNSRLRFCLALLSTSAVFIISLINLFFAVVNCINLGPNNMVAPTSD